MRFVQLRAFHHVCLHGGFSRAAEALYLTQPAISDQITKLETEYDLLLFKRDGKRVVPTPAGEKLLEISHRFFDAYDQAQDFLSERQKLTHGKLRVIADSPSHIVDRLDAFRRAYPDINIEIRSGNSDRVLRTLREYQADVGILGMEVVDNTYHTVPLDSAPLVALVHHRHPLAGSKSVRLATVLNQSLVLRETGSRTRAIIEATAREQNIKLNIAMEVEGREAVRELLGTGIGTGIVSAAEVGHDARLVAIPITDWKVRMVETLVCLRDRQHSKLISAFLDIAT